MNDACRPPTAPPYRPHETMRRGRRPDVTRVTRSSGIRCAHSQLDGKIELDFPSLLRLIFLSMDDHSTEQTRRADPRTGPSAEHNKLRPVVTPTNPAARCHPCVLRTSTQICV